MKNAFFAFVAAVVLAGCASTKSDSDGFGAMEWKSGDSVPEKAMIGDAVSLSANVDEAKFPDGTSAIFVVHWSAFGRSAELAKIETKIESGKAIANWKIEDSEHFYTENEYVVPKYSFVLEAAGEVSEPSAEIDIYGFIHHREIDEEGNPLANVPYTVYKSNGETIEGVRDEDGVLDLKWLPLGKYSLRKVEKSE